VSNCSNDVQSSPVVSDERLRDILRKDLHRAFNVDHTFTRKSLAEDSGVNIYQIDQIMSRDAGKKRRVAIEDAFSLALSLGDRTIGKLIAALGYVGQPADEVVHSQPMQIVANGMKHFAIIANAAADNRIDHTEERITTEAADALIAEILPLSSAGKSA
jgi:hypothetical protein